MLADVAETMMSPVWALARFAVDVVQADGIGLLPVAGLDQEKVPCLTNRALLGQGHTPSNPGRLCGILMLHWNPQFLCRGPGCYLAVTARGLLYVTA